MSIKTNNKRGKRHKQMQHVRRQWDLEWKKTNTQRLESAPKKEIKQTEANRYLCDVDYIEENVLDNLIKSHIQLELHNIKHKTQEELEYTNQLKANIGIN